MSRCDSPSTRDRAGTSDGDGLDPDTANWAASVSGGHVGRACRLATDPQARRQRRERALGLARDATPSRAYAAAELVAGMAGRQIARRIEAGRAADGAGGRYQCRRGAA